MNKRTIEDYTAMEQLDVVARHADAATNAPALIKLIQRSGSMEFLFAMTPDQARALASTLIVMAVDLDPGTP